MRRELKKRGIKKLKVVYSKEPAITPLTESTESSECIPNGSSSKDANPVGQRKRIPGSNAFVPSVAGLIIASEVIKDLVSFQRQ
jgi:tRNA A37 threonylcarbamoyladenosine dehydratase